MGPYHKISDVSIQDKSLLLKVDGYSIKKDLAKISTKLAQANLEEQQTFEISPSGYGIRWPLIDEDISIDGLMDITHNPGSSQKIA